MASAPAPRVVSALFLLGALALAGCKGEEPKPAASEEPAEDAGTKKNVDKKLAAAIAAAESAAPGGAATANAAAGDGPPDMGVFAPGKADQLQAQGAPPKVEVFNEGSEPKTQLAYAPLADDQKTTLQISVRLGPQSALPTIDFELLAHTAGDKKDDKKDKKDKKGDKKAEAPPSPETPAGSFPVAIKIVSAATSKDQPASLPKEISDKISKLKGSELRYALSPDGATTEMGVGLPKDAPTELIDVLRALAEAISLDTLPLPKKPVGAGAQWMVTDRSASFGIGVVRYRAVKVDKIEGGKATLSYDVREYAAKPDLSEGGQSVFIGRFDAQGHGSEQLVGALGQASDVKLDLKALLGRQQGQPTQPLMVTLTSKGR